MVTVQLDISHIFMIFSAIFKSMTSPFSIPKTDTETKATAASTIMEPER